MAVNTMIYCITTTQGHPIALKYPTCIEGINQLFRNEGYNGIDVFKNNEIVLNLDKVEEIIANSQGNREQNKSMDLTFGVSSVISRQKMMVLVELRLNYINPNNIIRDPLLAKVLGSRLALSSKPPIYPKYIFIFQTAIKEQAKSRLNRMNPKIPSEFVVMDIFDLKSLFF